MAASVMLSEQIAIHSKHLLGLVSHEIHNPVSNTYGLIELAQFELQDLKTFFYNQASHFFNDEVPKDYILPLQDRFTKIDHLMQQAKVESQRGLATLCRRESSLSRTFSESIPDTKESFQRCAPASMIWTSRMPEVA